MAHVGEDMRSRGRQVSGCRSPEWGSIRAESYRPVEHRLDATRIAGHERYSAALRSHEGHKFLHF